MDITVIPCLRDNYAYLVRHDGGAEAIVVDPSEAAPVRAALRSAGLDLVGILNTHHHMDHVGGNEELVQDFPGIPVFGHVSDRGRIPEQTRFVEHAERFSVAGLEFAVQHIPGHTLGAVAYIVGDAVFTGDTLFAAGCGRLFEGTPAQMYRSLNVELGSLPDATRVYCGHEYTANNLRFAASVEPSNGAVQRKAERVAELRKQGVPTVPSSIGEERETNPFLRCDSSEIRASVSARLGSDADPVAVLRAVRAAKDAF